jgi:hypothetical protein
VVKGNPVRARSSSKSLDRKGGETAIQVGGWGKGKGKGRAPGLGYQVNNYSPILKGREAIPPPQE